MSGLESATQLSNAPKTKTKILLKIQMSDSDSSLNDSISADACLKSSISVDAPLCASLPASLTLKEDLEFYLKDLQFKEFLKSVKILDSFPEIQFTEISHWNFEISFLFLLEISREIASQMVQKVLVVTLKCMKIPTTQNGIEKFRKLLKEIPKFPEFCFEIIQEKFDFLEISLKDISLKDVLEFPNSNLKLKILDKIMEKSLHNSSQKLEIWESVKECLKHSKDGLGLGESEILLKFLDRKSGQKYVQTFLVNNLFRNSSKRNDLLKEEKFYENLGIRNVFLQVFLKEISKITNVEITKEISLNSLENLKDISLKSINSKESLQSALDLLQDLPVYYFTPKEEKTLVTTLVILDKFYSQNEIIGFSKTRKLLRKFVKRCQSHTLLSSCTDYLVYLLNSVDEIQAGSEDLVGEIRWNTISIASDMIARLSFSVRKKEFLARIVEYRNQLVLLNFKEKAVYWDYLLYSSFNQLISKKGLILDENTLLGSIKIKNLSEMVLENVLLGNFDSKIDMLLVNQVFKWLEKCELCDPIISCTKRIKECIFTSQSQGSESWLFAFEVLCNWIKYLPFCVFASLLDSGWDNFGHVSVRNGFKQIIRSANAEQSVLLAQSILVQLDEIIRSLNSCGKEPVPHGVMSGKVNCVCSYLRFFFEMDFMSDGEKMILKQLPKVFHSLMVICALTPSYKSIVAVLEFCHSLIISKKFVLSSIQVTKIMEILSVIGESNICLQVADQKTELFYHIHLVINDIVRYQRESLLNVIPHLINILQDLLKCFRDKLALYPYKSQEVLPRNRYEILSRDGPLSPKLASLYSNIIMSMTQKSSRDVSEDSSLISQSSLYIKPFSKQAPFLLIEFITIQASKRPFQLDAEKQLTHGMYSLLNLCSKHGHDFILSSLDPHNNARPLFKRLVTDWEADYRFNGL